MNLHENKNDYNDGLIEITSPIVGTFYKKPDPDKPTLQTVIVSNDSIVCIVEAMKAMNEIKAMLQEQLQKF